MPDSHTKRLADVLADGPDEVVRTVDHVERDEGQDYIEVNLGLETSPTKLFIAVKSYVARHTEHEPEKYFGIEMARPGKFIVALGGPTLLD